MALRGLLSYNLLEGVNGGILCCGSYSTQIDYKKFQPMIIEKIQSRSNNYQVQALVPVAFEVLRARTCLYQGVSTLLKFFPIWTCRYCPELYVGMKGHLICTCDYQSFYKSQAHKWVRGSLEDILIPVKTFHLQDVIKHYQRFDFGHVPAVIELCSQAGAVQDGELSSFTNWASDDLGSGVEGAENLSCHELRQIANRTLRAWEAFRSGVARLLQAYPARVCKYCSEVLVGPSGHKAQLSGIFKHESWGDGHFWKKARLDDLVPPQHVWRRRPHDPPVLLNDHRGFYGHAPGVVELCSHAGAVIPSKYYCAMKLRGLSASL